MQHWWSELINSDTQIIHNADIATLIQRALHGYEGQLSVDGALVVKTGKHTGRAPEDKYVVFDSYTAEVIDWSNVNKVDQHAYLNVRNQIIKYLRNECPHVYISERSVSAEEKYQLGLHILSTHASAAFFVRNIFREAVDHPALGEYTLLHCPDLDIEYFSPAIKGPTVILINFEDREILIAGTSYAGEIKKAVFSVMNTLLPDHGVLPVHAGANVDQKGEVSVFFGLSGTGKTTLSTDVGMRIIGDDEHGLTSSETFNIEGGCYAKTLHLSRVKEPQIYKAVNQFGSLIENVPLDKNHFPDFDSDMLTENGRATYPLSFISNSVEGSKGPKPSHIFFLSADALGVLPAASKLSSQQAMYYFLSGYTSKLAGTEVNLKGVKATFSHCFGAPFMMRRPQDYAHLLYTILQSSGATVWLINTGWYGGPYGIGKRYDITTTRTIIRAIQSGAEKTMSFQKENLLDLLIPDSIPGLDSSSLHPRQLWEDKLNYDKTARDLRSLFEKNYQKFLSKDFAGPKDSYAG